MGLFLLALLHVPSFRASVWWIVRLLLRGLHWVCVDLPLAVLNWPWFRRFLHSRLYAALSYYLFKPALPAAATWMVLLRLGIGSKVLLPATASVFLASVLLINSRFGRALEGEVFDRLARAWHRLSLQLVPELLHFILDLFKWLLEEVERGLYAIDEWLRFRSGERRRTLVAKALAGLVWSAVSAVILLTVNLFIEPTFNPIKHFPTVTVAAKLLLPFLPDLIRAVTELLLFLGPWTAEAIAWVVFALLPGFAGFMVWELKENWRLYAANRARMLRPAVIGTHGETMRRLLRPGFHSGTLPRLYGRLRRADAGPAFRGTPMGLASSARPWLMSSRPSAAFSSANLWP